MVFNKLTETIDAMKSDSVRIAELERAVDEYRDSLMRRLRQLLPKLSERDYRVALYSFAGFSNRAIAIFIDSDPVSVSKIKYNIKTKIKSVESVDVSALVAALSEK
jgi:FixJ family two-component response regulator